MKTITITCDHCKGAIIGNCIEIGSENGYDLKYSNSFPKTSGMNSFQGFHDLHFCSKDCELRFYRFRAWRSAGLTAQKFN